MSGHYTELSGRTHTPLKGVCPPGVRQKRKEMIHATAIEQRRAVILSIVDELGSIPSTRRMSGLLAERGIMIGYAQVACDYRAMGLAKPKRRPCVVTSSVAGGCDGCRQWIPDVGSGWAHLPLTRHGIYCAACCPVCSTH